MEKRCIKCGEIKPLSSFYKDKGKKDGYMNICKSCASEYSERYYKTKKGVVTAIYRDQRSSSKKRKHPMPNYSNKELREWLFSQKRFHELYDTWEASGYINDLRPSCDRIDDYQPYTLDNLRIVTWRDNMYRHYEDVKNGLNNKRSKAVLQFTLDGEFVAEYYSQAEAGRRVKINPKHISSVCIGKRKTTGGFIWKFKD